MNDEVLIAVDQHRAHNRLAVIDPASPTVVAEAEFPNTGDGYRQMMRLARRMAAPPLGGGGMPRASRARGQFLVASTEPVVDVPAKSPSPPAR
jgi:hypothetical protein